MNLKDMLEKITQLSEATKETPTGRVHKAEPGGYGRKYDTDEEGDEKKKEAPAAKRGRGRPKKGSDETGEVKKYDWSAFGVKSGKDVKLPKHDKSKTTKHSLKEYFDEIDAKVIKENVPPGMKPLAILDPKNQQAGAGVIKSTNPAVQKMLGNLDPKDVQIVMTTQQQKMGQQPTQPTATAGGAANQPAMAEEGGEKWIQKAVKHPGAFTKKAKAAGKSVAAYAKEKAHAPGTLGKQARLAQTLKKLHKEDMAEADLPPQDSMASPLTLEGKKPDFPDIDNDKNTTEPISKAAQDAKKAKKKVKEGMEHRHKAARHAGKAHALAKEAYNCRYDDMDEARCYHEGYKEGLDECYGQMPVQGLVVGETTPPATVPGMANQAMPAMEAEVEEGNAFTAALARTPHGGKFNVGGKTFTDRTKYDAKVDEMAFESWDNQLNSLLESKEEVAEGMSVSISKGQQGAPDSVSVTAQDGEAEQLLSLIKKAGLGLFGGEQQNGYGAPSGEVSAPGGIDVVDDNDGMMALIKKVTGAGGEEVGHDYEEEGGHEHEEVCDACGEAQCQCDDGEQEMVDEVESEDQMTYQVAEETPQQAGQEEEEETSNDEHAEAEEDMAAAEYDKSVNESDEEDEKQKDGLEESSYLNLYKKIAWLSEESTKKEDEKAEKAGKKVTKDIEYDDKKDKKENKLDEWANEAGKRGTDASFETDIDFMMNVISSGLNKRKSTGQTTIPVIAGQEERTKSHNTTDINESVNDWKKLAGI